MRGDIDAQQSIRQNNAHRFEFVFERVLVAALVHGIVRVNAPLLLVRALTKR